MSNVQIRLEALKVGSVWEHAVSHNHYVVRGFGLDTTTNCAVVRYGHAHEVMDDEEFIRPIGEFLGSVKPENGGYVPRFRCVKEAG